jgi:beta-galactosidase
MQACFLSALFLISAAAGSAQNDAVHMDTWFPPEQLMTIGVYYYPEAWPEQQWERDIANIRKLGFEYIHMSEFA